MLASPACFAFAGHLRTEADFEMSQAVPFEIPDDDIEDFDDVAPRVTPPRAQTSPSNNNKRKNSVGAAAPSKRTHRFQERALL